MSRCGDNHQPDGSPRVYWEGRLYLLSFNTDAQFGKLVSENLARALALPFREADNHFEAQASEDACVELSGAIKAAAVALTKIANDIRWLSSGPRCGIGEIVIPPFQPASSIMPGKVSPVMAESLLQV